MDSYATKVRARGYPYRFKSAERFAAFKSELRSGLGLPASDVRLQGSALRNPDAKDIDIAVFLDDAGFNRALTDFFAGKVKQNGIPVELRAMSEEGLAGLATQIRQDTLSGISSFNAVGRTFENAFRSRKLRPEDVPGLRGVKRRLETVWGEMDLSIMSRGGVFDMEPNMQL